MSKKVGLALTCSILAVVGVAGIIGNEVNKENQWFDNLIKEKIDDPEVKVGDDLRGKTIYINLKELREIAPDDSDMIEIIFNLSDEDYYELDKNYALGELGQSFVIRHDANYETAFSSVPNVQISDEKDYDTSTEGVQSHHEYLSLIKSINGYDIYPNTNYTFNLTSVDVLEITFINKYESNDYFHGSLTEDFELEIVTLELCEANITLDFEDYISYLPFETEDE